MKQLLDELSRRSDFVGVVIWQEDGDRFRWGSSGCNVPNVLRGTLATIEKERPCCT